MKTVRCFIPGRSFPAVSVTGSECDLCCPHCMGHPLSNMLPAETAEKLLAIADRLENENAIGFLLSGGCDSSGALPIKGHLEAISSIKANTSLKINAHLGYPDPKNVPDIVSTGIDVFSVTYPINDNIGKEIFMVPEALARYNETHKALEREGAKKIVPHVLVGLADIEDELEGIRRLEQFHPRSLVILTHIPLRNTPLGERSPPENDHIIRFVSECREILSDTKLILGCMRNRGQIDIERYLIENYLDGIVMPDRRLSALTLNNIEIEELGGCCALYL